MPESFRETLSNDVILDGVVEYDWYVGCTPTAVATVMGYWDRHGFNNLIQGDTSSYTLDIKEAIASQEHFDNYYYPKEKAIFSSDIKPDKSELGGAHKDNSIADFLQTSRSIHRVSFGVTQWAWQGIGVHGYASYKGYEGFETTFQRWGSFSWDDVVTEIDSGRPVMFAVDSSGDGVNDHDVVVIGYNQDTKEFAFHDGWFRTDYIRWEPFTTAKNGYEWGVTGATFVRPPKSQTRNNLKSITFVYDGTDSGSSYKSELLSNKTLDVEFLDSDIYVNRGSIAMATADGHTFYQLYNDGKGTASLNQTVAYGDGRFQWTKLNPDSRLGRSTIGLATADGNTFYVLDNDGVGSAALYEAVLKDNGTFDWKLLNSDSKASNNTIEFATTDGKTFYQLYDDGSGTATLYESVLQGDGTFSFTLLDSDSGLSRDTVAHAMWESKISPIDFSKTSPKFISDKTSPNSVPDAQDDVATTSIDKRVKINVLSNDFDPNGDSFILQSFTQASNGTIKRHNNGTRGNRSDDRLVYIPDKGFAGTDSFTYTIKDSNGGVDTATVTVTINDTKENQLLEGDADNNTLEGLAGNDTLKGYAGNDNLVGGAGNDRVFGNAGNDRIDGSDIDNGGAKEFDVLGGGGGKDTFVLGDSWGAYYIEDGNKDYARINDFVDGKDSIELFGSREDYRTEEKKLFFNDDELIAVFNNSASIDLNSDSFVFV